MPECNSKNCDCGLQRIDRRHFLKVTGATGALAGLAANMPVMAGPFESQNDYLRLIPADKKLDPQWLRSLTERGEKEVYTDSVALRHIGMPIGGLFTGTVYLSGDGRLWLWDVFNKHVEGILPRNEIMPGGFGKAPSTRCGLNYLAPAPFTQPFQQGFSLRIGDGARSLDSDGFRKVTFDGRYPIGRIMYEEPDCPVTVALEAFSPFIPLNVDDSSLPAIVNSFTVTNTTDKAIQCEIAGNLENAVCLHTRQQAGRRRNQVIRTEDATHVVCRAAPPPTGESAVAARPDVVFEDFESGTYDKWTVVGTAFGKAPLLKSQIPAYQGNVGGKGKYVVNSHSARQDGDVAAGDSLQGSLTSKPFTIVRKFVHAYVGGGAHAGETCVNVLVGDEVVASVTGASSNRMALRSLNLAKWEGKEARIQIVDHVAGAWGNVGVDHIVFSDSKAGQDDALEKLHDFGSMALTMLESGEGDYATASVTQ